MTQNYSFHQEKVEIRSGGALTHISIVSHTIHLLALNSNASVDGVS
jgi:hypothetical protein